MTSAANQRPNYSAPNYSAEQVIDHLGLVPLDREGGLWAQTQLSDESSAIYYLLRAGDPSHLHRLPGPEIYHYYLGDPAELVLLLPSGSHQVVTLGPRLLEGHRVQHAVDGGVWQGSVTTGAWTLLGTTMTPPFSAEDYEHGSRPELVAGWPAAIELIGRLTD